MSRRNNQQCQRRLCKVLTLPQQVKDMMQLDDTELYHTQNIPGSEKCESVEDKYFQIILTTNMQRIEKGDWKIPLLFKKGDVTLLNTLEQCMKRLLTLKRKLLKNGKTLKYYIILGSSRRSYTRIGLILPEEQRTNAGKVWYLPHFLI